MSNIKAMETQNLLMVSRRIDGEVIAKPKMSFDETSEKIDQLVSAKNRYERNVGEPAPPSLIGRSTFYGTALRKLFDRQSELLPGEKKKIKGEALKEFIREPKLAQTAFELTAGLGDEIKKAGRTVKKISGKVRKAAEESPGIATAIIAGIIILSGTLIYLRFKK